MKKTICAVLAVLVLCLAAIPAFAGVTYWKGGGSSGSGGSGTLTGSAAGLLSGGEWKFDGKVWTYVLKDGSLYKGWGYIYNPYATGEQEKTSWFYFDPSTGYMLTGWQWIKAAGGLTHRYYLHTVSDGTLGRCYISTTTPDKQTVNKNGEWAVEGVAQSR